MLEDGRKHAAALPGVDSGIHVLHSRPFTGYTTFPLLEKMSSRTSLKESTSCQGSWGQFLLKRWCVRTDQTHLESPPIVEKYIMACDVFKACLSNNIHWAGQDLSNILHVCATGWNKLKPALEITNSEGKRKGAHAPTKLIVKLPVGRTKMIYKWYSAFLASQWCQGGSRYIIR